MHCSESLQLNGKSETNFAALLATVTMGSSSAEISLSVIAFFCIFTVARRRSVLRRWRCCDMFPVF